MEKQNHIPRLRFPDSKGEWEKKKLGDIIKRIVNPVDVRPNEYYHEIGIRSHGNGLFYKEKIEGRLLGNKRVFWIKEDALIFNIVFAWEQAVAKTTSKEKGMIASHRFPMYLSKEKNADVDYLLHFFLTNKGKTLLELASPGGAGRNKTLGQVEFLKLRFLLPSFPEQQKIASFFNAIDKKISQLKQKKTLLEQYKKGVMQKIFSQEIRFKSNKRQEFPNWEKKKLGDVLFEHKTLNANNAYEEVFSVAKHKGVINQIEHLGRSYSAKDISNYKVIFPHDIVYTKSPTSDFPFGIIKQNLSGRIGVVSPLYGVFKPISCDLGFLLHNYFLSWINTYNYLNPLVQKGAKNTMNINNDDFLNGAKISVPVSIEEQNKIGNFLSAIDDKINHMQNVIEKTENWKKGLMQQMFV